MCNPLIVMAAVAVAQQVASHMSASSEAKATEKAAKQQADLIRQNTVNSYASQQLRIQQEQDAAARDIYKARKEGLETRATASTAAAEAGVSGLSVDALLGDISRREGEVVDDTRYNLNATTQQIRDEMEATRLNSQSQLNAMPRGRKPTLLGLGFGIGQAVGKAYAGGAFGGNAPVGAARTGVGSGSNPY